MYKLREVSSVDNLPYMFNRPEQSYNGMRIEVVDVDNRLPYGLDGGKNWKDTEFYHININIHRYVTSWINTPKWVGDLAVSFSFRESYLNGNEVWNDSFDNNTLIDSVEKMFTMYMDNIFVMLDDEIKTDGRDKFWSDKGFILNIQPIEEDLKGNTNQKSEFKIIQSSFEPNSKGDMMYFKDDDKGSAKVPKRFKTISKEDLTKKIRIEYLKVANRFLSQDFENSLHVMHISDFIRLSMEEKIKNKDCYKNTTVFTDVIKK